MGGAVEQKAGQTTATTHASLDAELTLREPQTTFSICELPKAAAEPPQEISLLRASEERHTTLPTSRTESLFGLTLPETTTHQRILSPEQRRLQEEHSQAERRRELEERLSRRTSEEKEIVSRFASLNPKQRQELLEQASQDMRVVAELRMKQLELIKHYVEARIHSVEEPATWGSWLETKHRQIEDKIGSRPPGMVPKADRTAKELQEFLSADLPKIQQAVLHGRSAPSALLGRASLVLDQTIEGGLNFFDFEQTPTREGVEKAELKLIKFLRAQKDYGRLEQASFEMLEEQFSELAPTALSEKKLWKLRDQARAQVEELVSANRNSWQHPSDELRKQGAKPMAEGEIVRFSAMLQDEKFAKLRAQELAKAINPETLSGTKRELWALYNDVMDPKGEWLNVKDSTQDAIVNEVVINAPLIMVSGGVGSLARAGVTSGARAVAGRMIARAALKEGLTLAGKEAGVLGAEWLAESTARRLAIAGVARLAEGAAFEATHLGLQGEWIGNVPNWGQRILWTCATLGLMEQAGKLGERAFRSLKTEAGKVVLDEAGMPVTELTRLGRCVSRIENESVRKLAEQFLVKGHLEVAAMLVMGAAQEGVYHGDVSDLMENYQEHILHAYISVGALKLGHQGIETLSRAVFRNESKFPLSEHPLDDPTNKTTDQSGSKFTDMQLPNKPEPTGTDFDSTLTGTQGEAMSAEIASFGLKFAELAQSMMPWQTTDAPARSLSELRDRMEPLAEKLSAVERAREHAGWFGATSQAKVEAETAMSGIVSELHYLREGICGESPYILGFPRESFPQEECARLSRYMTFLSEFGSALSSAQSTETLVKSDVSSRDASAQAAEVIQSIFSNGIVSGSYARYLSDASTGSADKQDSRLFSKRACVYVLSQPEHGLPPGSFAEKVGQTCNGFLSQHDPIGVSIERHGDDLNTLHRTVSREEVARRLQLAAVVISELEGNFDTIARRRQDPAMFRGEDHPNVWMVSMVSPAHIKRILIPEKTFKELKPHLPEELAAKVQVVPDGVDYTLAFAPANSPKVPGPAFSEALKKCVQEIESQRLERGASREFSIGIHATRLGS